MLEEYTTHVAPGQLSCCFLLRLWCLSDTRPERLREPLPGKMLRDF